jgi:hypothetical protein
VAEDEQQLKDLTRKVAQLIGASGLSHEESRSFEEQIGRSRVEIDERRRAAQQALEALTRDAAEARRALQAALENYQNLRREMDRLQPQLAENFSSEDRLARDAEPLFPAGQVRALAREIDDASAHFGMLDPKEQLAQLTIWIGRYRRLQALEAPHLDEDDAVTLQRIFPRLVGISKQYEPGYIEAFRQGFNTDWDAYVADAEEQFRRATEHAHQKRQVEHRRREQQARDADRQRQARDEGVMALEHLKAVIARYNLPEEGLDEFHGALATAVAGLGVTDPELLELVAPWRDLLTGSDFRALRKHLDRAREEEDRDASQQALKDEFADLIALTRGRKALMIGGSAREDMRRTLERIFEFEELDWENFEGKRPAFLDSLEQRVGNRSLDLVLILKEFIGHEVPNRLRPACEAAGVPCLMIEHGYGPAQVAETLRRGLLKSA